VRALQRDQPWGQPYAPNGPWTWGSNGRIGNNLMLLGSAYLMTGEHDLLAATRTGMDYLLGRNALGQSYVTDYGADFSRHQRTRHFTADLDPAFRRRPAPQRTRPIPTSPTTRDCRASRRSWPTWTCLPPKPRTMSVFGGTPRWSGWPPFSS
jgi:Glycosyl hydrolase family 9